MNKTFDIFFDVDNNAYQVRTKNDVIVIEFSDEEKKKIFESVIKLYDKKDFYTFSQLVKKLSGDFPHEKILDVIKEFLDCSLLNSENFENEPEEIPEQSSIPSWINQEYKDLSDVSLGFIGDKEFAERFKEKVSFYEYKSCNYLDIYSVNEAKIEKLFATNDFLIVDTSRWNPYYTDLINEIALKNDKPWLLVEGLIDPANFSMGPIFHGKETGCYECYSKRLRSNDEFQTYTMAYEKFLRSDKKTSKPDEIKTIVKDLVATIIIMDISKYIGGWYIPEMWRTSIVINTGNFVISKHFFLKAPICYTCKPELDYNQSPWFESVTLNSK